MRPKKPFKNKDLQSTLKDSGEEFAWFDSSDAERDGVDSR
jgi:hypothetical protein